jgi:ATP-dependent DNA ligase
MIYGLLFISFLVILQNPHKYTISNTEYYSMSEQEPEQRPSIYKEYTPIFGKDKSGKTRVWKATIFAFPLSSTAMSVINHGIHEGKLQVDTRQYTEGKNIGKKNETTPLQQCVSEVEKKRKDKIEKEGYSESLVQVIVTETDSINGQNIPRRKVFPMLANKYEPVVDKAPQKKRKGIVFPCFVQPKLDGLRCVVYLDQKGAPIYQSRTGGYFAVLQHLDAAVNDVLSKNPTMILDGELYTTEIPFEELAGIIKKKTLTESDKKKIMCVQYHIYDLVVPDISFHERLSIMQQNIRGGSNSLIQLVPTDLTETATTFKEKFSEYVEQGYEGIMLRNTEGLYQENYRSNDLMKYKEFFESEYPIVDYREAMGRDAGTVIWECETPEGRRFGVRPRGTQEVRREWFLNGKQMVGKQLTVIYQELSEMGVPRFPVGKAIRDGY